MADKQFDKAAKEYETVLQTDSQNPDTWRRLGIALNSSGQSQDALAAYREAVRLGPYRVEALNDLAWFLATDSHSELRDGTEAIRLAEKACALSGETEPRFFGTFDAALAEAGRFDEAIKMASKTIKLAKESGQTAIAEAAAKRIELYKEHKPCHF
jgi:cytochrome c-type biogenesis protein CcmH/NrfG